MSSGIDGRLALLCDADGCLFPSEEPAFAACAEVANRLIARLGGQQLFTGEELRLAATGKNFRAIASGLCAKHGIVLDNTELERWVEEERREVTAHLRRELTPDREVAIALGDLAAQYRLSLVSSSASVRIDACLRATGLGQIFPPSMRFSAEDSLPIPRSKPDPAIYRHALSRLGTPPERAIAIEDSVPGVTSAVAAGLTTIGNLAFVPDEERPARGQALARAGASALVFSWAELEHRLLSPLLSYEISDELAVYEEAVV